MTSNHATTLGLALVLSLSTGCQVIWASITSPSDWVSGSSRSLGGSSEGLSVSSGSDAGGGGGSHDQAFRDDVRVLTVSAAQDGTLDDAYLRALGDLAREHGVNDWQTHAGACDAIGAGLRQAGFDAARADARVGDWCAPVAERVTTAPAGLPSAGR